MARIHFIVNPQRPSIGLRWPYAEKKIQSITDEFAVHITRGRLHAEILARQAAEQGADLVVAVGGDSTLSEIVNGLLRASQGNRPVPRLSFHSELQKGDAIRTLEMRPSFEDFLRAYLAGEAVEHKLDVGEIEYTGDFGQRVRRHFINAAGMGFSAVIIDRLSRNYKIKRTKLGFVRLMIRLAPFYRHPRVHMTVDGEKVLTNQEILTALVHNGRYAGSGLDFSPESNLEDGKFELTIAKKSFSLNYLLGLFSLFAGKLSAVSFVSRRTCQNVEISGAEKMKRVMIDFDGDRWGYLPARIQMKEKALTVLL